MRMLITGASGSGTTTLGRAISDKLKIPCFDLDDYYWIKTDPPFQTKREPEKRLTYLLTDLSKVGDAVLSGSLLNWGKEIEDSFSVIVFLTLDTSIRVKRLYERETALLGHADPEFLKWAEQYDQGTFTGRSRVKHEKWLSERTCEIIRIDGDLSVEERISRIFPRS